MLCSLRSLFPHRVIRSLSKQNLRDFLVEVFEKWGLPKAIRTDNGSPLGAPSRTVIPIASLWLAAWGIRHILNRPKMPTDNPNVENNQATSARWAEIHTCENIAQVEAALEQAALYQRDYFKVSRLKTTRKALYPRLYKNPRPFDKAIFDVHKAYQLLAKAVYPRKISASGTITIYEKHFSIGLKYRGLIVFLVFNPKKLQWVCMDQDKNILKTLPDPRFCEQNLYNLDICQ